MPRLSIDGARPLRGHIRVSGAKNAVLEADGRCAAHPGAVRHPKRALDRRRANMIEVLEGLGAHCQPGRKY